MKKLLLLALLLLLPLCACLPAGIAAETPPSPVLWENGFSYTVTDGQATIQRYDRAAHTVTIPLELGGYPVAAVTPGWLVKSHLVEVIAVEAGHPVYTSVDGVLFAEEGRVLHTFPTGRHGETYEQHYDVPEGTVEIGRSAFEEFDRGLSLYLTLPESLTTIRAYGLAASVVHLEIPPGVTVVEEGAFRSKASLTVAEGHPVFSIQEDMLIDNENHLLLAYLYPAFYHGTEEAVVPDGVLAIGAGAFYDMSRLESVRLPEGLEKIGAEAFYGCSKLAEINIPDSLRYIGDQALYRCNELASFPLPEGLESIGALALSSTHSGIVEIPAGVTHIGSYAFNSGVLLRLAPGNDHFLLTEGLLLDVAAETVLGYYPGAEARQTVETIEVPEGMRHIGDSAFYGLETLTSIQLPAGLETIGEEAFRGCEDLPEVVLPEGLTTIGRDAFQACKGLAELRLPNSLTSMAPTSFSGVLVVEEGHPVFQVIDGMLIDKAAQRVVHYDRSRQEAVVEIPEGVVSIGERAFSYAEQLTDVVFPDTLRRLEDSAFRECTSLTSLNLPDGFTDLEAGILVNCRALTEVRLPDSLRYIGTSAFSSTKLTEVEIPDGVEQIAAFTFNSCWMLCRVALPDSVLQVGDFAFSGCEALEEIALGTGLLCVGRCAFDECTALTAVVLPNGLQWLGISAFQESGLASVWIPSGVTYVSGYAFANCSRLGYVEMAEGVETIGVAAFKGCGSLSMVQMPRSIREISSSAFDGDKNISFEVYTDSEAQRILEEMSYVVVPE